MNRLTAVSSYILEPGKIFDLPLQQKAFAISALVLLLLAPISTLLGAVFAYSASDQFGLNAGLQITDNLITMSHSVFIAIGTLARVVSVVYTGGWLLYALTHVASFSLGSAVHRFAKLG